MRKRKMIAAGLVFMFLLQLLVGCSDTNSDKALDATLYSYANDWVDEVFLASKKVKGAYYRNENTDTSGEEKWIEDESAPDSRTFIITTEERYDEIFVSASSPDIDFEKQTVILYIASDVTLRNYDLKAINLRQDALTVKMKLERGDPIFDDSVMNYPRCFMLVIKKIEITKVKFEEIK